MGAAELSAEPTWVEFEDMAASSGIDFVHVSGTSEEKPFPAANGSGLAVLDFDLDGRQDLYFATGTPFPVDSHRLTPRNRLYRNQGGWQFSAAAAAGLDCGGYSAGIAAGDYDADGFPDVYVTSYGENRLFRNRGDGTFEEVAECRDNRWATSAAFFDADGDGLLDLYVCNYAKWTPETNKYCGDSHRGIRIFCTPRSVEPDADVFYQNVGDGNYEEATEPAGFNVRPGRGQGVVAADLNGDGRTDLYVGNDLHPNTLFLAGADGVYKNISEASGAAYDHIGGMQASMGVDAADINGDGLIDLFVTNYQDEHNTLYVQSDVDYFNDVSRTAGLAAPSLPWVGWGTSFADFDVDGQPDLVVTNGHTDDNLHELGREGTYPQPPLLFRNREGRFQDLSATAGPYFSERHVGRALAVGDLDDDLAPDLVVGHQDAAPALLRNNLTPDRNNQPRLRIRVVGTRCNRDAIGATLTVSDGETKRVIPIVGGGSYLSARDPRVIVAAPRGQIDLTVHWPWGKSSRITGLTAGNEYVLVEPMQPSSPPRILKLAPSLSSSSSRTQ